MNLGAAEDFSADDGPLTYILSEPFAAAGREHQRITVHNKYYDPQAAPEGKSALTVFLDSEYNWWKNLERDTQQYQEEKNRCAEHVIAAIDRFHPGFRERVEVIEVSTPLTRERYTGNWMWAMQARKPKSNMIAALMQGSPRYAVKGCMPLASGRKPGEESQPPHSPVGRLFKLSASVTASLSRPANPADLEPGSPSG